VSDPDVFWSWSGHYLGYRSSDCFFSSDGRQVGYFAEGEEVYGSHGQYLAEVRSGNRLITNLSKKKWTRDSFVPRFLKSAPGHVDVSPKELPVGFEDFTIRQGT
jgi:hypothetical protein